MKTTILIFMVFAQSVLAIAQKNETKQLDRIENKVDSVLILLSGNGSVDTLLSSKSPNLSANSDSLYIANSILNKEVDSLKKVIVKEQISRNKLENASTIDSNWQKKTVELDIVSVINQSTDIGRELLQNIQTRAIKYGAVNQSDIKNFIELYDKIKAANEILNNQYNFEKNIATISQLNNLALDKEKFPGLYKSKMDVLFLLENYCQSYKEVSELIDAAKDFPDESERKKILQEKTYIYDSYPFLIKSLQDAKANKKFVLSPVTSCQ